MRTITLLSIFFVLSSIAQVPGGADDVKFTKVAKPVSSTSTSGNPANEFYHATYTGASWGDPDDNGLMDLFYSDRNNHIGGGAIQSNYYINNGDGTMRRNAGLLFAGTAFSAPVWFDYNNDGCLDLFVSGLSSYNHKWLDANTNVDEVKAHLYHNKGNVDGVAKFEEVSMHGITPLYNGLGGGKGHNWVAVGDYDKDGYTDILMAGFDEFARIKSEHMEEAVRAVYLYRNVNGKYFELVSNPVDGIRPFDGMTDGSVQMEDLDGDGWLDIFTTGYGYTRTAESHIYWNNGDGSFTQANLSLRGISNASSYIRDLNNDGMPDLIYSGVYLNTNKKYFYICKNLGNRQFEVQDLDRYEGFDGTQIAFGDVNNDGYVDLLLGGHGAEHEHSTVIYVNQGDFNFDVNGAHWDDPFHKKGSFSRVSHGTQHLIDIDNDGYLDAWFSGWCNGGCSNGCLTELWHNDNSTKGVSANVAPSMPENLSVSFDPQSSIATFTWDAASDDTTPAQGLRYNFYLKKSGSADCFMVVPSNIATGYIKVGNISNAINKCQYQIRIPDDDDYEWGVQAIDNANCGGLFKSAKSHIGNSGVKSIETSSIKIWGGNRQINYKTEDRAEVRVTDLRGMVIKDIVSHSSSPQSIDISFPGIFIVNIITNNISVTQKVNVW